jgi:hypothetical protein
VYLLWVEVGKVWMTLKWFVSLALLHIQWIVLYSILKSHRTPNMPRLYVQVGVDALLLSTFVYSCVQFSNHFITLRVLQDPYKPVRLRNAPPTASRIPPTLYCVLLQAHNKLMLIREFLNYVVTWS